MELVRPPFCVVKYVVFETWVKQSVHLYVFFNTRGPFCMCFTTRGFRMYAFLRAFLRVLRAWEAHFVAIYVILALFV